MGSRVFLVATKSPTVPGSVAPMEFDCDDDFLAFAYDQAMPLVEPSASGSPASAAMVERVPFKAGAHAPQGGGRHSPVPPLR